MKSQTKPGKKSTGFETCQFPVTFDHLIVAEPVNHHHKYMSSNLSEVLLSAFFAAALITT